MLVSLTETADFLKSIDDVVILTHMSPDGDCIGAGFALSDILESFGKRCRVECCDGFPKRYDFMTRKENSANADDYEPRAVVAVDVADEQLLGSLRKKYGGKVQLCIDHHFSNTKYAERLLLDAGASATCEIIYELAEIMGAKISDHCAACIYTGIATDTGCFRYDCTTPRCHEIVADIMREHKLNYALINREMFDVKTAGRMKLECALVEQMEYYFGNKVTLICITAEMMDKMGVDSNDLEGCAALPLQVEGAQIGIMVKEREKDIYKVSMRSSTDVNVSEICMRFGGGGHKKAAGCQVCGDIKSVKHALVEAAGKALGE